MMTLYVGVDPGVSGGFAVLSDEGVALATLSMPDGEAGIMLGIKTSLTRAVERAGLSASERLCIGVQTRVTMERVHASPQMGVSSAFTFGRNKGAVLGILAAFDIPVDEVTPTVWQKAMGVIYPKGEKRDKNVSKRRAAQLFPSLTITHAIADALLIAEYGRRMAGKS